MKRSSSVILALSLLFFVGCGNKSENKNTPSCEALIKSKNYQEATSVCENECNNGKGDSCTILGLLYAKGQGVTKDHKKAIEYLTKACNSNSAKGCLNLGVMYANGMGVPKDTKKATFLFRKACDLGEQEGCKHYQRLVNKS
ncbi:MAG: sel1 repeat family protein [Epsilonproteobacteria bacterium]|nr:sel1 repeat family protein [Campylobacterota bacterium]